MTMVRSLLLLAALMALAAPVRAQERLISADPSGQFTPLHPLSPPSPGSVDVLPAMPPMHDEAGVTYISGGIGGDQQQAMRAAAPNYNLHLLFAGQGSGEYLSNVRVTIAREQGTVLLNAVSDGPFFMAKLPSGRYRISADDGDGRPQTRSVIIPDRGALSTSFFWRNMS